MSHHLSPAQKRVWDEVLSKGAFHCAENYRPAQKLIALGMVKVAHRSQFGRITIVRMT